jgi:type IV pilus assembly protein PilA
MKKLESLKKSEKGFTLVEIIVVLVIIAILAAITIPTLIGYINNANEKQILSEARSVLVAAQAQAIAEFSADGSIDAGDITAAKLNKWIDEDLCVDTETATDNGYFSITPSTDGKVTSLIFTNNGYTATYENESWSTAKVSAEGSAG